MISLGGLVNQKAFGKFEMGKVISNPFATAFVNEAEGEDHEVSMGQNQLDTIIKMATELKAKMGENEKEIPAWIQDHISKAENYISQAAGNYHEYGTKNEAMSAKTPKIFVKTAAVEKKIKELMADRKKAVVPYNSETDPAKKEKLKQILIKLTNQIKGYEKNLVQLRDMEEEYLQQMHADAELDTTGL